MTVPAPDIQAALAGRPALLQDACQRALAYLGGLAERRVAPAAGAVAALGRLDFALPGSGLDAPAVLGMLAALGWPGPGAGRGRGNLDSSPAGRCRLRRLPPGSPQRGIRTRL